MHCPEPHCNSTNTKVTDTYHDNVPSRPLPKQLQGLNVQRRRIRCLDCHSSFFTIEMLENDFDNMRRPPGRLETQNIRMRP